MRGACIAALLLGVAVPALAQEPGKRLQSARLRVVVQSPTTARVVASFELAAAGPLEVLLTSFSGQHVDWRSAQADGVDLEPTDASGDGATVHRILGPGLSDVILRLDLDYDVTVPAARAYRFPLPVPQVPVRAGQRSVLLDVELPPGMRYTGDGFPGFDSVRESAGGQALGARLVAVPAFAHVVFAEQPVGWHTPLRLQAAAVVLTLLPLAVFGLWLRRRRRRQTTAS